ncbi:type II secretion system protein GspD [Cellulophaga sp. Hel_I_12]|uniref:type II secretion system protein GspD n=1 Tax=Cellulophaga sp. Hel_I_12 TaxID=1249972 RepID=UPI00064552DF|nr:secretin N-terminal domain-containing protein [Cellulophaga sp. Hel_I_12]
MKKNLILLYFILFFLNSFSQDESRIQNIKNNLEFLAQENEGLSENLKLEINVTNITLSNFLLAISNVHKINIAIDPSLEGISLVNNFSNVTVADLLVFLCKEYDLAINFTGNIISIYKFIPEPIEQPEKEILVQFDLLNNQISLDLKNDPLEKVFRKIIDISGQNLLFTRRMENLPLTFYAKNVPFESALEKLAELNNLTFSKSRDGFYLFDTFYDSEDTNQGIIVRNNSFRDNLNYQVLDTINKLLTVDFNGTSIEKIIQEIGYDLGLDIYTATPLSQAGLVTFKAKEINFDSLLEKIFESQRSATLDSSPNKIDNNNPSQGRSQNGIQNITEINSFTYKKENDIYFFGTTNQLSVRNIEVIPMMHRSIELLGDPTSYTGSNRTAGRTNSGSVNFVGGNNLQGGFQNNQNFNNQGFNTNVGGNSNSRRINTESNSFGSYDNEVEALVKILPDDLISELDIKVDYELNSFLVSGPAANINRFKNFIKQIDKPVPVILIEVMILEVNKSSTVETGISWGIGDEPTKTQGSVFPTTDITFGAETINKVIGGFDGFGSFNVGKLIPDFFATIKAMEQNGNIKIRSTPKLSTLNGHRARLSIGETTYYVVTNQNFFGSQIPTSTEIRNYQPIDAELAISIKPLVSGNGQVTLDINVLQSDFSGERIENDAPPGLTSREFSSIIRVQNQDMVILGGLEEKIKNDSGNGVPFLARVPLIKWLFSSRKREDSKKKLTILIKPTVIY